MPSGQQPTPQLSNIVTKSTIEGDANIANLQVFISPESGTTGVTRPDTWPVVQDTSALSLGVHRARSRRAGTDESVPPYVGRDFDNELRLRLREASVDGGMILLTGDSTAGKSRAAFEAVKAELPGHQVFAPSHGTSLGQLPEVLARRPGQYVLWLDDLEGYLGRDGLQPDVLSALLRLRVTVVGTLRDGLRDAYRPQAERQAATAGDQEAQRQAHSGSHVLNMAELVEVPRVWSPRELQRAHWEDDPRLVDAVKHHGKHGIAEYLAAGPELWQEWRQAMRAGGNPRGAALVAAAVDLARTGLIEPFTVQLLEEVHEHYLTAAGGAALRPEPLPEAWEWVKTVRYGVTSLLVPGPGDGEWRAFDYLIDAASRNSQKIPEATWLSAIAGARDDDEKYEVGWQAFIRDAPRRLAAAAFEPLALAGDAMAANNMGVLSENRILEQAKGNFFGQLMELLSGKADIDEALGRITSMPTDQLIAEPMSALNAAGLLGSGSPSAMADAEQWYRRAFDGGYAEAAKNLAELLRQAGRRDEAVTWYKAAAEAGVASAARDLGQLHEQSGNLAEAERWYRQGAEAGDHRAADRLRQLLQRQGRDSEVGAVVADQPGTDVGRDAVLQRRVAVMKGFAAEALRRFQAEARQWGDPTGLPSSRREPATPRAPEASEISQAGTPTYGPRLWNAAGRRVLYGHNGAAKVVCTVDMTPRDAVLASGGVDGTIRLWNPSSGQRVGEPLSGHDSVTALCQVHMADGRTALASGDLAGQIRLWDIPVGRLIRGPFNGHQGEVTALCPVSAGDTTLLASGGSDGLIHLWDVRPGRPTSVRLDSGTQPIRGLCSLTLPGGITAVASATGSGERDGADSKVQLWAADTGQPTGDPFGAQTGNITVITTVHNSDGATLIASGHDDGTIRVWDPRTGEHAGAPLTGNTGPVGGIGVLPLQGGVLLAVAAQDGTIQFWHPDTGRLAGELASEGRVRGLCVVPVADQQLAIAAAGGGWSPDGGRWCVQIYYSKGDSPGVSGRRGVGGMLARVMQRHGRADISQTRPAIAVETDNAVAISAFTDAVEQVEQGHIDAAEAKYREGWRTDHYPALNGLGMILEARGELDEAERLYRKAATSSMCQAELNLGDLLKKRGKRSEAARWYRKFATVSPLADPDAIVNFLLDDEDTAHRKVSVIDAILDADRIPELDLKLDDVEYSTALAVIAELRAWRHAHDPARSGGS
jgi:WD40 repeat protein/TPR repeat protein